MRNPRLDLLTDLYVAGSLSAELHGELYALLLASPAARERFDRRIAMAADEWPQAQLLSATEFLEKQPPPSGVAKPEPPMADPRSLFHSAFFAWQRWSAAGAIAACLLIAVLFVLDSLKTAPPFEPPASRAATSVAVLRHAANVEWVGRTNEVFAGDKVGAEELQLAFGSIQLEFHRGARVVVDGPARIQLVSDNEAFLHSGSATAFVPESAHGFRLNAPLLAVTDLGTEFGLQVRTNQPVELHVFTGAVQAMPPRGSVSLLKEGQAVRAQGRRLRDITANRSGFVFEEDVKAFERSEQSNRFDQWQSAANALSLDPAALLHYTFEQQDEASVQVINRAARAPRGSAGALTATWSQGRWPDKHGIAFSSKADRIRFTIPTTLTSLTYMAWLRVDKLTSVSNALAVTESGREGEVHWQIYQDGRVALSARSGKPGPSIDDSWDRGLSPPIFTAERLGKWTHLTSVYDVSTRSIRHYLDGVQVSSTPIKRPVPIRLGAVEIGNWGVRGDERRGASANNAGASYWNRHWTGCIDEFALLARAMSDEEIRTYYAAGRVATGAFLARAEK